MIPVYHAGFQLIKVRAVMIASLACLAWCLWSGFDIAQTHGLREADGGVLAPWWQRLALGGFVALLGIAFAAGMWLYGSVYVGRIEFDPALKRMHFVTIGFFWNRRRIVNLEDLSRGGTHDDLNWEVVLASAAAGHPVALVNAAWTTVWIRGWRLPLILDEQGVILHERLMRKFLVR